MTKALAGGRFSINRHLWLAYVQIQRATMHTGYGSSGLYFRCKNLEAVALHGAKITEHAARCKYMTIRDNFTILAKFSDKTILTKKNTQQFMYPKEFHFAEALHFYIYIQIAQIE